MMDGVTILEELRPFMDPEQLRALLLRWGQAVLIDGRQELDAVYPPVLQRLHELGLADEEDGWRLLQSIEAELGQQSLARHAMRAEDLVAGLGFASLPEGGWRGDCPLDPAHRGTLSITAARDGYFLSCAHGCDQRKIHALLRLHQPRMRRLSDVASEPVRWLWKGWIPFGKFTLLDGRPGQGKSTATLAIAAQYTRGLPMPGETQAQAPGAVLVVACEDGIADTIRPRFDVAGGDPTRLFLLEGTYDAQGRELPFRLPEGAPALERAIRQHDAKLVILDPLSAFLGGDTHRDAEVRQTLTPLAQVAERTGAAIVAIRHLRKEPGPAIYSGGGAVAIIALARSALLVMEDPEDEKLRILASIKSNLGPRPQAWRFALQTDVEDAPARIEWKERCDIDPDDFTFQKPKGEDHGKRTEALAWLKTALAHGPVLVTELFDQAKENGIAKGTLKRAFLQPETEGFRPVGADNRWYRRLKGDAQVPAPPVSGSEAA